MELDKLSLTESRELTKVMEGLPNIKTLHNRPKVVDMPISINMHSAYDWIPSGDIEYYKENRHRKSSSYDWSQDQFGVPGYYTVGGVKNAAKDLCNISDELLPYEWAALFVTHFKSTSRWVDMGPLSNLFNHLDFNLNKKLGDRYSIYFQTKYTFPISFVESPGIDNYIEHLKENGFNHNDFFLLMDDFIKFILEETVIVYWSEIDKPVKAPDILKLL